MASSTTVFDEPRGLQSIILRTTKGSDLHSDLNRVKSRMAVESPLPEQNIADQLHRIGHVLLRGWRREETTIAIGRSFGSIVDIQALLPGSNVPTVQTLKPRHEINSSNNRYSGTYGLGEFPLHTDLAHWARPPRYFVLRCQSSSNAVVTRLLASSVLESALDSATLHQALVRPRRSSGNRTLSLLPLTFCIDDICGLRWDPLFLVPMNEAANQVAEFLSAQAWHLSKSSTLVERGDTLIVDNWRFLHGRGKVSAADVNRRLERVYLSEIQT